METQRISFTEVFHENPDGSLTPRQTIEVNGIKIGPGAVFQKGVSFGGIDFQLYKYRDIAVQQQSDGMLKILGFYEA